MLEPCIQSWPKRLGWGWDSRLIYCLDQHDIQCWSKQHIISHCVDFSHLEQSYPNSTATNFATAASKVYNKTTMYRGYRSTLDRMSSILWIWNFWTHWDGHWLSSHWVHVSCQRPWWKCPCVLAGRIQRKIPKNKPSRVSAQTILSHSNECRELFGFGYHIIKDLIRPL